MATNDIGRVTPIWRGFFSAATTYELNDIVIDTAGSVWWHKSPAQTTGEIPEAGEIWDAVIDMSVFSGLIQAAITTAQTALEAAQEAVGEVSADTERAETAASNAETSALNAAESAASVGAQAQAAERSAEAAAGSATGAAGSAQAAAGSKSDAEAYAVGKRGGEDVESTDPTYHNNAKYYSEQAESSADAAAQSAEDAQDVLNSIPADYSTLSADVGDLKESTDKLIENATKYDPFDFSTAVRNTYYIPSSTPNMWLTNANRHGYIFPVDSNAVQVMITANENYTTAYAFLTSNAQNEGGTVNYCAGTTRNSLQSGGSITSDIPVDCKYMWVLNDFDGNVYTPSELAFSAFINYDNLYVSFSNSQDLSTEQKAQGRANIGAANSDDVEMIKTQVNNVSDIVLEKETVDFSSLVPLLGVIAASNPTVWLVWGDQRIGYMLSLPEKTNCIFITANAENPTVYALLKTNTIVNGAAVDYATGETRKIVNAGETIAIDVPDDCYYLWVAKEFADNKDYTPDNVVYEIDAINTDKKLTEENVPADAKSTGEQIQAITDTIYAKNLFTGTLANNKMISKIDGYNGDSNYYSATSFIDIRSVDKILFTCPFITVTSAPVSGYAFYDEQHTYVPDSGGPIGYNADAAHTEMLELVVPDNAVYFRTTYWKEDSPLYQDFELYNAEDYDASISGRIKKLEDMPIQPTPPLGLHEMPENIGVLNAIKRARAMSDVVWTPAVDLPRVMYVQHNGPYNGDVAAEWYEGTFKAGVTYKGIPYGRASIPNGYGYGLAYMGHVLDLKTFVSSVTNPQSMLCKESTFKDVGGNYAGTFYSLVCSAFVTYVINVQNVASIEIKNITGMTLIGPVNDSGTLLDDSLIKLGDLLITDSHSAVVTDIIRDTNGVMQYIEITDASPAGLADRNYDDEQVGGVVRRKGWTRDQFYDAYGWGAYGLYRYNKISQTPYTPSPYESIELNMQRVEHFPCMPYAGEGFPYKYGYIPNTDIVISSNLGYDYLRVFKDGVEISGSPFSVTVETTKVSVGFSEIGSYEAYLCTMSNGADTKASYKCHWTVT